MVVCENTSTLCPFTIVFGVVSIICLILLVAFIQVWEVYLYRSYENVVILFFAYFLCILMILTYFLEFWSEVTYFLKDLFILALNCLTSYYFIFQANAILENYSCLKFTVMVSVWVLLGSFASILVLFVFRMVAFNSISCDNIIWVVMRTLAIFMSILFLVIGFLVHSKLMTFKQYLNAEETRSRLFILW